jgi:peptidoglycan/LPS O-acetylase OafA/YrhL
VETGKKHLASLDSLRGIALILISANHFVLATPYILFGWTGVWLFFSLSGYLITDGLLKIKLLPLGQYFGRFYAKRAFRILPAFVVFLAITIALYFAFPRALAAGPYLGRYWIYIATFTFNHCPGLPTVGGFWFAHLWTLSVEEQFYIVWPWLIFFLPANWLKRIVPAWIILAPVLRLIVAHFYSHAHASIVVSHSLLCQADAFAIGGCVAIFRDQLPRQSKKLMWAVTAGVIAIGLLNYFTGASVAGSYWRTLGWPPYLLGEFNYQYVWGYTVINIWSATLILSCLQGTAPSFLNFPPLVFLGRISYAGYLYHMPLLGIYFFYLRPINPFSIRGFVIFLIWLASVTLVAWISFRVIELPFLRIKNRLGKTRSPIRGASVRELPSSKRLAREQ